MSATDRCETCNRPVTPGDTFHDEETGMEVCAVCEGHDAEHCAIAAVGDTVCSCPADTGDTMSEAVALALASDALQTVYGTPGHGMSPDATRALAVIQRLRDAAAEAGR